MLGAVCDLIVQEGTVSDRLLDGLKNRLKTPCEETSDPVGITGINFPFAVGSEAFGSRVLGRVLGVPDLSSSLRPSSPRSALSRVIINAYLFSTCHRPGVSLAAATALPGT